MQFLSGVSPFPWPIAILDETIPFSRYCPIDLSISNEELKSVNISDAEECQRYILDVLGRKQGKVAYGGYLERRKIYDIPKRFHDGGDRNIHLGMDFWCDAGTKVVAPLRGVVHSFANNSDFGNYGPTIILEHHIGEHHFYTLYGHLSLESISHLKRGQHIKEGTPFASLGTKDINVGYAPHLHFQIILDLGRFVGDYPGVSSEQELEFHKKNSPDPNLLLGYPL